jgi:hypothetical protein
MPIARQLSRSTEKPVVNGLVRVNAPSDSLANGSLFQTMHDPAQNHSIILGTKHLSGTENRESQALML